MQSRYEIGTRKYESAPLKEEEPDGHLRDFSSSSEVTESALSWFPREDFEERTIKL